MFAQERWPLHFPGGCFRKFKQRRSDFRGLCKSRELHIDKLPGGNDVFVLQRLLRGVYLCARQVGCFQPGDQFRARILIPDPPLPPQ